MIELKSILSNEKVEAIAEDVLEKTFEKATEQLKSNFYDSIRRYLHEHHLEYEGKIFDEIFNFICGEKWSKYKDRYSASKLRARLYEVHKEEIDKLMTEQLVEENIKRFFGLFLCDEEITGWRYVDLENKVVDWIYENYEKSKLKGRMLQKFVKENESLRKEIERLTSRLNEISELAE